MVPVAICTHGLHMGTGRMSDGHAGFRTHPRNLLFERIVPAQEPGTPLSGSRRALSPGLHLKAGSWARVIQRVFGIAARAMDFSSESDVGRKFVLWDSEETGLSRSPRSGCPTQKHGGCHPHRRFSTFILGLGKILRRSGFHWVNKPSKSSRPPAFPKGVDTNWRGALARSEKHRAS